MINFEFWTFSKKKNSTKQPTTKGTIISVNLKHPTSIESPTLLIEGFNLEFNYAKGLGHYYFVSNITFINNSLVEVELVKDVLATYKNEIGLLNAFINRSDSDFDVNLNDNEMTSKQKIGAIGYKPTDLSDLFDGKGCYLLRVASESATSVTGIKTYIMTKGQVRNALSFMFSNNVFDSAWDSVVKATFNPFQYIISLKYCALSYSVMIHGCSQEPLQFGWWTSSDQSYYVCNYVGSRHNIALAVPERFFNDFRDFNPQYSSYQLLLPASGLYEIPSVDMSLANFDLQLYVDALTGKSTYYMLLANSNAVLYKFDANVCADVQLSQNSTDLTSALGSIGSAIGSAVSGNIYGTAVSSANALTTILQPTPSSKGGVGSIYELVSIRSAVFYDKRFDVVDQHPIGFGRPLNQNRQIGTLSGFVKCSGASISISGHSDDIEEINSHLNSGFYYE